ncbi:hypothetical protein GCM10027456_25100 [Kineosporia babensis]
MNLTCPRCGARVRIEWDYEGATAICSNGTACGALWDDEGVEQAPPDRRPRICVGALARRGAVVPTMAHTLSPDEFRRELRKLTAAMKAANGSR